MAANEKNMELTERPEEAPTALTAKVVHDDGPLSHLFDTARFEQLQRLAKMLACSSLTPKHLVAKPAFPNGNPHPETLANCFRVANQAVRWGFDIFAVADSTYVVAGKLGYEGKLVAAVINARAGLVGSLRYSHSGAGDNRTVTVYGRLAGEDEDRTVEVTVSQAKTGNDMWKKDPDQKLCYNGAIKWARRHSPEVVMGVLTDDDLDQVSARDLKPQTISDLVSRVEPPQSIEHEIKNAAANEPGGALPEDSPREAAKDAPVNDDDSQDGPATDGLSSDDRKTLAAFLKRAAKADADTYAFEFDGLPEHLKPLAREAAAK